jgi:NAD(P)-dependent dehydrogenase (short-subunit alcohol dehydrogenase family)
MADIRGKWALVTGASRGVGRQIALGLAQRGCKLVLHSRDLGHTAVLAKELAAAGTEVHPVSADLSDQQAVGRMVQEALRLSGGLDIVYNNAAIMTPMRMDWLVVPPEDYRASFEVNFIAVATICHAVLPGMLSRHWGRIVNVTSGIRDQPELIAYAASKAALDKFVRDSVVRLAGSGVLMNLLDPGWLRTDLGGPSAPNAVESVLPGALVPALIDDGTQARFFCAQDFVGQTI